MNSRTNLRLSLQREQSIQNECKGGFLNQSQSPSVTNSQCTSSSSSSIPISVSAGAGSYHTTTSNFNNSIRNSPNINSSFRNSPNPINNTMPVGNRLFHYPQIIHVQAENSEEMGRKNLTLSNSLPPGLNAHNSPPKNLRFTENGIDGSNHHHNNGFQNQHQVYIGSRRHSPAELSPTGFADSPTSASFTSAQSELDDVIIDEILSMEEEQKLRDRQQNSNSQLDKHFANSYSYADNLSGLLQNDNFGFSRISYNRQVSNSAPTSTLDIEGLVRDELCREQETMRDRRKKDVHNMIERRRRYNINDRIKELGTLLPKSEEMKMNKGTILKASVDYIRILRKEQDRIAHVHQKQQLLELENKKMLQRIQDLELQLKTHGVPLPSGFTGGTPTVITTSSERIVKSEPVDDNEPPTPLAMMHSQMTTNPLSPYHAQNNLTALPPPRSDYDPPLNGRNFMANAATEIRPTYYSAVPYSSTASDIMFSCVDSVLSSSNDHYNQYKSHNNRDLRMPEMILDLGCENLNTPGLMSSMVDPLISAANASRLLNSQAPSPDVHWDAATFSPEAVDKMDFILS